MILAVNIGNTNIRVAAGEKNQPVSDAVFIAKELTQSRHFINLVEEVFTEDIWDRVEASIVTSVVPKQTEIVVEALISKTGKPPKRVDVRSCGGLDVRRYEGSLGEDRVVCCVGALQKFEPPFILIDFGTATTVNVVNGDREFLGGAILPGVKIGLKALSYNTAQLPRIEIEGDVPVIGKNTAENMLTGAIIGSACAAEGFILRVGRELNCTPTVIITGGNAPLVLPYCNFEYAHEPGLLFDGLFALC